MQFQPLDFSQIIFFFRQTLLLAPRTVHRIAISYPLLIGERFLSAFDFHRKAIMRDERVALTLPKTGAIHFFFFLGALTRLRASLNFQRERKSSPAKCLIIRELIEVETSGEERWRMQNSTARGPTKHFHKRKLLPK